jgi:hypothetical protein
MQVGNLVRARQRSLHGWTDSGVIIACVGRKWFKVAWADGVIQQEHVDDLEVLSASASG